jgi:hypothetical protein
MISIEKEESSAKGSMTDHRRDLLERVLASPLFSKSERLSSLLIYICNLTLESRTDDISEQTIGRAVFGRSENYDSANDGIVRTQISRLRQKLDLYFEGEGSGEAIRIVIPRGGYVPFFVPHAPARLSTAAVEILSSTTPAVTVHDAERPRSTAPLAWGFVGILLAIILVLLLRTAGILPKAHVHRPLWSRMFPPGQPTLLVPADSTMVFWQALTKQNIGLADYLKGAFRDENQPNGTNSGHVGEQFAHGRYTSIVDLEVASRLSQIAQQEKGEAQIRYARDVRPNDLKQGNIILVGANEANPWVYLFEKDMNFIFRNDREREIFSVINRSPRNGEPRQWDSSYNKDQEHRVYCVVAYRPNLGGNGNVLILEGTSMAGTECAWDFVSDDSELLPFLKQIQHSDGSLPGFEVVLGTSNMSGSAVKSSILAWRTSN